MRSDRGTAEEDKQATLCSKRMPLLHVYLDYDFFFPSLTKHSACFTQLEQSDRKANSFKIGGEITRNWRPFKNIITSLFPQREVQGWGSFLIRTGDEFAINLLIQTMPRFMQLVCVYVCACAKSVCEMQELIILEDDY